MSDASSYDAVIIGAGMGGLTVGALLARSGARVALVEAHDHPGGCCHTFPMGEHHRFCAAVHYIFSCGEGQPVHNLLRKLGLHERVTFERLDPDGYDRFSCPSAQLRFAIPNGLERWCERMCERFPAEVSALRSFFQVVMALADALDHLPARPGLVALTTALLRSPRVLQLARYRSHTLQQLLDEHGLSVPVQAILATQVGDVGLPPAEVSLLIWCALVARYGEGAWYPTEHFSTFIEAITDVVRQAPGCRVLLGTEVTGVRWEGKRIAAVSTRSGEELRAQRFICNADPQAFVSLAGPDHFPPRFLRRLKTEYSASSFSVYLSVRGPELGGVDLREHGFGNWNVWHYPSLDINGIYAAQHRRDDLSDPWLFLSTPTLCSLHAQTRHAPQGEQLLELITTCAFEPFSQRRDDLRAYTERKNQIRDRMIDIVDQHYVPGLRQHLALKVAGTPTTNKRYLWAPRGNIYGSALTPANVHADRLGARTPIDNLFFVGASASFPSIGGTVGGGNRLYTALTGDSVT